jgi:hypothetical protein
MSKINCPACAGPTALGGGCATCSGTTEIIQEVFDAFMVEKAKQEESQFFWVKVQKYMHQTGKFRFEANEEVFELDN